jgi:DNA-binding response OmpR family regulator
MPRVLIVEDEKNIAMLCRQELEEDGHEVATAGDAEAALRWLERNDVDVIVLDLEIPGRSGVDLLPDLLRRKRDARILIHTAYPEYKDDFATWGADAYVVKSGDLLNLRATVAGLVRKAA